MKKRAQGLGLRAQKIVICLLSIYLLSLSPVSGGSKAGTTGSAFLTLDAGAEGIGMGSAFTALADDASAIYWNPAGLARIQRICASLMHAVYFTDIRYNFASYAHRLDKKTTLAGALYRVNHGAITQTDIAGNTVGIFSPSETAYALAVAQQIEEFIDPDKTLYMGMVAKYMDSKIVASASGYAGDVGLQLVQKYPRPYSIGIAYQNFGQGQKFDKQKSNLPTRLKASMAAVFFQKLTLSAEGSVLRNRRWTHALGAQWSLAENESSGIYLRGGYNSLTERDLQDMAGLNVGFGLSMNKIGMDYALSPFGELGNVHRISLNLRW